MVTPQAINVLEPQSGWVLVGLVGCLGFFWVALLSAGVGSLDELDGPPGHAEARFWPNLDRQDLVEECPLWRRNRTLTPGTEMSPLCQEETLAG